MRPMASPSCQRCSDARTLWASPKRPTGQTTRRPRSLVELTATWFARSLTVGEQPVADHAERLEQLIQQTRLEGIQGEEQAEERLQIRLRLLAEAKTEAPRDRYLSLPKPDPNLAPSPRELHELLVRGDEPIHGT
jgi:hypothetical protein